MGRLLPLVIVGSTILVIAVVLGVLQLLSGSVNAAFYAHQGLISIMNFLVVVIGGVVVLWQLTIANRNLALQHVSTMKAPLQTINQLLFQNPTFQALTGIKQEAVAAFMILHALETIYLAQKTSGRVDEDLKAFIKQFVANKDYIDDVWKDEKNRKAFSKEFVDYLAKAVFGAG